MDRTDEKILDLLKGNARMTYKELGDQLGMSRVAAMKRVKKLEKEGIIRGYNTTIYRDDEITAFIDIVTVPGRKDSVLDYVGTRTIDIRQIFTTTKENHIHMVAVSSSVENLRYMANIIFKHCEDDIEHMSCHLAQEIVKDVYGGVRYERRKNRKHDGNNEQHGGSEPS